MNKIPDYFIVDNNPAVKDATLIIQAAPPYLVGQVWRFRSDAEKLAHVVALVGRRVKTIASARVIGYRIEIEYYGSLAPHKLKDDDIAMKLDEMAAFYRTNRIELHEAKFKRYAE